MKEGNSKKAMATEFELTTPAGPEPTTDEKGDERGDCETSSSIFNALGTLSFSVIEDAHRFLDSKSAGLIPSGGLESPGRRGPKGGPASDLERLGGARAAGARAGKGLSLGGLALSASRVEAISSETSAMAFFS